MLRAHVRWSDLGAVPIFDTMPVHLHLPSTAKSDVVGICFDVGLYIFRTSKVAEESVL